MLSVSATQLATWFCLRREFVPGSVQRGAILVPSSVRTAIILDGAEAPDGKPTAVFVAAMLRLERGFALTPEGERIIDLVVRLWFVPSVA